jgi:hypothetical protein
MAASNPGAMKGSTLSTANAVSSDQSPALVRHAKMPRSVISHERAAATVECPVSTGTVSRPCRGPWTQAGIIDVVTPWSSIIIAWRRCVAIPIPRTIISGTVISGLCNSRSDDQTRCQTGCAIAPATAKAAAISVMPATSMVPMVVSVMPVCRGGSNSASRNRYSCSDNENRFGETLHDPCPSISVGFVIIDTSLFSIVHERL